LASGPLFRLNFHVIQRRICILTALFMSVLVMNSHTAPASHEIEFFEKKIRPVLISECYECHGSQKKKGGLRLDSRQATLDGGDSGPAILPRKPNESLLIRAIRHDDPDLKMPEKRPKLSALVIADFVSWIQMGAPDPRDTPDVQNVSSAWEPLYEARRTWWSLQPLTRVAPPAGTATHPVDRFLEVPRGKAGLQTLLETNRNVLLRRLTYDLTGLPPTPEELERFVADPAVDAWELQVDRLLASPRFGERWARHWMDLVRFAETHGSEGDPEIYHAWRYRDYLIRSFNADLPYNQFVREQIAGDLLPNPRWNKEGQWNESMLGIAQFRLVEHGFQPVDTLDEQVKVIENQIDVLGKTFLGLTLACARCHDHKFDPISQKDYYALYGVMASVRPALITIDEPAKLKRGNEELTGLKEKIKAELIQAWRKEADYLFAPPETSPEESQLLDELSRQRKLVAELARKTEKELFLKSLAAKPVAAWTFESDSTDVVNDLPAELLEGARVERGRLLLNGRNSFLKTAPLPAKFKEKTLEAWVALGSVNQGGGGVLTIQKGGGSVFDSIVFAEKDPGCWMAGSDGFQRTQAVGGAPETKNGELHHLLISYTREGKISVFRDGVAYGKPYELSGGESALPTFENGTILMGLRHSGAANGYFEGEIEEARLYDRAFSPAEVTESYQRGPFKLSELSREVELGRENLRQLEKQLQNRFPKYEQKQIARERFQAELARARPLTDHPLHPLAILRDTSSTEFSARWRELSDRWRKEQTQRSEFGAQRRRALQWDSLGVNSPVTALKHGEFAIEPQGPRLLTGIYPKGRYSHLLSQKHNGVLLSETFTVDSDAISVKVVGGAGTRIRLITDNYPIGSEGIFPQREISSAHPVWLRLDVTYRKGAKAYLEIVQPEDMLARNRPNTPPGNRSYFGLIDVVFHSEKQAPTDDFLPVYEIARLDVLNSFDALQAGYKQVFTRALDAWEHDSLTESQAAFLESLIRFDVVPNRSDLNANLAKLVRAYRETESAIPAATRAPGVVEGTIADSPIFSRGDPTKPLEVAPRAFPRVLGGARFAAKQSGRAELAEALVDSQNPLTARVMVNRIWQHMFGAGLVRTPDNFGRMGELPSHPELLDYLSAYFMDNAWSVKKLIRFLATSEAYRLSSEVSAKARETDPDNRLYSHASVRRLEAEEIRDAMLQVAGRLELRMYGRGADALGAPAQQRRRSLYLTIRRNSLSPFLEVFDAPKPFTTWGRRDRTNVPAQSLTLLNDPFTLEMAAAWAERVRGQESLPQEFIETLFVTGLARKPSFSETMRALHYLDEADGAGKDAGKGTGQRAVAEAMFNLKEFIYLR
jgi:hypothetical protein